MQPCMRAIRVHHAGLHAQGAQNETCSVDTGPLALSPSSLTWVQSATAFTLDICTHSNCSNSSLSFSNSSSRAHNSTKKKSNSSPLICHYSYITIITTKKASLRQYIDLMSRLIGRTKRLYCSRFHNRIKLVAALHTDLSWVHGSNTKGTHIALWKA